jgi:hypothetical protein
MTLVSLISRWRSASFDTSKATSACFFVSPLCRTSSSILMLTGPIVSTLTGPLHATRCSWPTTSSPDPRSARMSSLVQAPRQSTAPWLTEGQRRVGFVSCLWSRTTPYRGTLWSTATTSGRLPLHQPRSIPVYQSC